MSRFTEEQGQAITWRHNLAVTAGAGAGKTRVLVERFLGLLAAPDAELEQLVAITFTEKAAREMRQRVREALYERAGSPDPAVRDHARRLLERLERARISTFHSFCQTLLRAYPVEAGADPDFRLIDELESGLMLAEAVEATLDEATAGEDPGVVELLSQFSRAALAEGLAGLISQLRNLGLTPAGARDLTRRTLADQAAAAGERRAALAAAVAAVTPRTARGAAMVQALHVAWEQLQPRLAELDGPGGPALADQLQQVARALDRRSVDGVDDLRVAVDDLATAVANPAAGALAETLLDLAGRALDRLQAAKAAGDLMDFGDLIDGARRLLAGHPAIRAEWGGRCRWIMVDEFQDTDLAQWEVIRLLLGEPLLADRLFIVGDAKQSIYRFRGARVELFGAARQAIAATAGGGQVNLDTNFRSQAALIEFANHIFGGLLAGYEPMRAHRPRRERAVELLLALPEAGEGGRARRATREREAGLIATRIAAMAGGAEARVWEKPHPGAAEEVPRPVRYGDIAILLQAMTHVNTYALALARAGIPHYVVAGNGFFSQQEVLDVFNLLSVLDNPADSIALLGVLRSPYVGLADAAVFRMGGHPGGLAGAFADPGFGLPDDDGGQAALAGARALVAELRRIAWQEPLPGVLPAIYAATGIYQVLLARPDGERRVANLEKLAATVRAFGRSGRHQFADLLGWLRVSMDQSVREGLAATEDETGNTVRIMTVHQAKGLEFPVVFLPDMGRRQPNWTDAVLLHPEVGLAPVLREPAGGERPSALRRAARVVGDAAALEEFRRLFYVAATRARDVLVLAGRPEPGAPANPPPTWLQWTADGCGRDLRDPPAQVTFGTVAAPVVTAAGGPATDQAAAAGDVPADAPAAPPAPPAAGPFRRAPGWDPATPLTPEAAALVQRVRPVAAVRQGEGLQIGVTRLLDFQDCARKYYLKYILAVPDLHGLAAGPAPAAVDPAAATDPDAAAPVLAGAAPTPGDDALPAEETALEPTVRGQVVHAVCEELTDPVELEWLLRQAAWDFRVDPAGPAFDREVVQPLRRYAASDFFNRRVRAAAEVRSEVPFRLRVGDLVLEGQIDKLLISGGQATVVDFKTNQVEGEAAVAAAAAHYRLQMEVYALAVAHQLGLPVAEAVLYFLMPGRAVSLAPDAGATRRRVEEMGRALAEAHGWDDFAANPGHCPHCQYHPFCQGPGAAAPAP